MDLKNETLIVLSWELHEEGLPKRRIGPKTGEAPESPHMNQER